MKKAVIIALIVLILCCIVSSLLLVFKGKEWFNISIPGISSGSITSTTSNTNTSDGKPYLEMTLKNFPGEIFTVCQPLSFSLEVKNTGSADLSYSDIIAEKFDMTLLYTGNNTAIASTTNNSQGMHVLNISDFGTIKKGETKTLSLNTKDPYFTDSYQNGFITMQNTGNGSAGFLFEFSEVKSESSKTMISNRPNFTIDIQAFEYNSEYDNWSNKVCN